MRPRTRENSGLTEGRLAVDQAADATALHKDSLLTRVGGDWLERDAPSAYQFAR